MRPARMVHGSDAQVVASPCFTRTWWTMGGDEAVGGYTSGNASRFCVEYWMTGAYQAGAVKALYDHVLFFI